MGGAGWAPVSVCVGGGEEAHEDTPAGRQEGRGGRGGRGRGTKTSGKGPKTTQHHSAPATIATLASTSSRSSGCQTVRRLPGRWSQAEAVRIKMGEARGGIVGACAASKKAKSWTVSGLRWGGRGGGAWGRGCRRS